MMNPYKILGMAMNAPAAELTKAYRRLILVSHPDRNGGSPEALRRTLRLNHAYEMVSTPERRQMTDTALFARCIRLTKRAPVQRARAEGRSRAVVTTTPPSAEPFAGVPPSWTKLALDLGRQRPQSELFWWVLAGAALDKLGDK